MSKRGTEEEKQKQDGAVFKAAWKEKGGKDKENKAVTNMGFADILQEMNQKTGSTSDSCMAHPLRARPPHTFLFLSFCTSWLQETVYKISEMVFIWRTLSWR